ncbi:hypothetical protein IFJ75_14295 [Brevundimonas goettingensis]|uniref:Uncharacterized protein n=1 Tax=Brevundimonas goettingensis TaxID=2774190 RepID=A0A975BYV2_9CAUL|nr:hypothetical protein IFJ75_14295 [Brevundimonas goettingensis]
MLNIATVCALIDCTPAQFKRHQTSGLIPPFAPGAAAKLLVRDELLKRIGLMPDEEARVEDPWMSDPKRYQQALAWEVRRSKATAKRDL